MRHDEVVDERKGKKTQDQCQTLSRYLVAGGKRAAICLKPPWHYGKREK
jgi:hypothetical protein